MKEDHRDLYDAKLRRRTVTVTIKDYNRENNSFLGTIVLQNNITLQELLVAESLVYTEREYGTTDNLRNAENKAKKSGKGLWS